MKKIVIYIDVTERWYFFKRVVRSYKKIGFTDITIITHRLSIFLMAKQIGLNAKLLKNKKNDSIKEPDKKSISVLNNYHTKEDYRQIFNSVYTFLVDEFSHDKPSCFYIWNGTTSIARGISAYAKDNKIPILFLEISNLPGKLFVDPLGTSGESLIAKDPEKALSFIKDIDKKSFELWRQDFINLKIRRDKAPKQVKNIKRVPYSYFVDILGFIFLNAIYEDKRNPLKVLINKLKHRAPIKQESRKIPAKYIFLPLQTSNDAQVKIFSNIDNKTAIELALKEAKNQKIALVVKFHPAEPDVKFMKDIIKMSHEKNFIISSDNTYKLIERSDQVNTINSTVGLEAMLFKKPVVVYGSAIYKKFSYNDVIKYIQKYLIPIDFFAHADVDIKQDAAKTLLFYKDLSRDSFRLKNQRNVTGSHRKLSQAAR